MTMKAAVITVLLAVGPAAGVSPVQKVVQLLEECKAKVESDLATEQKAMDEYSAFCDEELKGKSFAIKTAERSIQDLTATIEDSEAQIAELDDEIKGLGNELAGKDRELAEATQKRKTENDGFVEAEKEMLENVDELGRATEELKKAAHGGGSLLQTKEYRANFARITEALSAITQAAWVSGRDHQTLKAFLQSTSSEGALLSLDDGSETLLRGAPKAAAFESATGGILKTLEEMQDKAESSLSDLRKKETEEQHSFNLIGQSLTNEIGNAKEKLDTATASKAEASEALGNAQGDLTETQTTKRADEEYSATLEQDCNLKAKEWEERQTSAKEEIGAIEKAKEILVSGVTASLVQVEAENKDVSNYHYANDQRFTVDEQQDLRMEETRSRVVNLLKGLGQKHHSFKLMQLATLATADPFQKIRGLVQGMIEKLIREGQDEATQKGFCDGEIKKSKASQDEKTMKMDKYKARIDEAETSMASLKDDVKVLEAEIAEIDKATKEATEVRTQEKADFDQASKDYRDSGEAVSKAIGVLRSYYEGALVQLGSGVRRVASAGRQPSFGASKSDSAHSIISILEMSQEDFTNLLAEAETAEDAAKADYEKLMQENKVSRAAKEADSKAKQSEIKSLSVALARGKEDHASTAEELDAVNEYLEKLKPECETKTMSYEERKAARESEIQGLKESLKILEGKAVLLQTESHVRKMSRA